MLSVRKLVFAGALLAVAPFAVFAEEKKDAPPAKAEPKAMPMNPTTPPAVTATGTGACAPVAKKCVLVPTQCQETRTVMKPVQKTETYTAYRYETVQEKQVVDVTTYKKVTETVMENRTTCVKVPCWEEKCVMETRKKVEWVTEYKEKCRLSFQKECKTIGCGGNGCNDGCGNSHCGGFSLSFPVIKPTLQKECVPVCVPKCTTECVPVMKKVCTWKTETKTECVPVCKTRCVPCVEKKEITVCKKVCVPYQATRCVTVCEPCTETVTVCKMVPTWVDDPCANACAPGCGDPCGNACGNGCGSGCGLFGKLKGCFNFGGCGLFNKCGFSHGCNTGCTTHTSCAPACPAPACPTPSCNTGCNTGCHIDLCGIFGKFKGCLCH